MIYYLSLGSNLGDRRKNLDGAMAFLKGRGFRICKVSGLYETEPVDLRSQPWFCNLVVRAESTASPAEVMEVIREVESSLGRVRTQPRGPRTMDIDILLAGKIIIQGPGLIVPHPRLHLRNFVLVPLAEIAPGVIHPVFRRRISRLAAESRDPSIVRKIGPSAACY